VPPPGGPELGLTALTVGASSEVNWSAGTSVLVPPGVLTVMAIGPASRLGTVTLHEVAEQRAEMAGPVPNEAVVSPGTKPVPVMVTTSPPAVRPALRLSPLTVGTAS
jgi:hypothetical protein